MQKISFYNAISNNNQYNDEFDKFLQESIKKYPYFKLAYLHLLKQKYLSNNDSFDDFLKLSAVYSNNRAALYDFIFEDSKVNKKEEEKTVKKQNAKEPKEVESKETKKTAEQLRKEIDDRLKEIKKQQNKEQTSKISESKPQNKKNETNNQKANNKKQPTKEEIIETFIKSNPKINKPEAQDYSETEEQAKKSLNDNLNFVSETLAEIYANQSNKIKAKEIYEQLMLKFPEKKLYFAGQIKKLGLNN